MDFTPESLHVSLAEQIVPSMQYEPGAGFFAQKRALAEKLNELLKKPEKCAVPPQPVIAYRRDFGDYENIRFSFESEPGYFVPAHLVLPKSYSGKLPVVICLQGHSTGMYLSLGETRLKKDARFLKESEEDFAIQAASRGWAAIAMEQRGFGEQNASEDHENPNCGHMAMQALLMGRTLLGERCHDVSTLIDLLPAFPQLDTERIALMGQSGGGTVTQYASATDERIKLAMPSCAFCSYLDSIHKIHHCSCNFIPDIMQYMDMPELSVLIAPRPQIIVCGQQDCIFPVEYARRAFERVQAIYADAGAPENCRLVEGPQGHKFYPSLAWPVFEELAAWN